MCQWKLDDARERLDDFSIKKPVVIVNRLYTVDVKGMQTTLKIFKHADLNAYVSISWCV